ncbi:MAG: response regulator [Anaerolineae bacterium]|nr:response regulator [Anaerolineae bacterium]
MATPMPRETFLEHLHDALGHLYHADHLRNSPLVDLLGLGGRFDRAAALRQILLDGIEALRPDTEHAETLSRSWRTYESLFCCYVQQLTQQIVADQLCISTRQLRREQRAAIELLADRLWHEHVTPTTGRRDEPPDTAGKDLLEEMPWAHEARLSDAIRLQDHVDEVVELTANLAAKHDVRVSSHVPATLPPVAMHPVFVKQALLSLVDVGIQQAEGGSLDLTALQDGASIQVTITARPHTNPPELSAVAQRNLQIVRQLVVTGGGHLTIRSEPPAPSEVELLLPVAESVPILVVDDNEDALQLYARYAVGTRYRLVSTPNPADIPALVRRHAPRAILLDIMMPQGNGWTVLGALRQDPLTRGIPIIVCTILPQEELALSLGASAFVLKPVSRQQFLAALDALGQQ